MRILAHRGMWFDKNEKNTLSALFKGLDNGYGLETDIRDLNGQLVISHDTPTADSVILLDELLCYYAKGKFTSTLALNIKSDGLQEKLQHQLQQYNIKHYFVFDMSIPDTLDYLKLNISTFIRCSDIEYYPEIINRTQGTWLDELIKPWISTEIILKQASQSENVCIVSAELHNREHTLQWSQIKKALDSGCQSNKLLICTDFPQEAERYFK